MSVPVEQVFAARATHHLDRDWLHIWADRFDGTLDDVTPIDKAPLSGQIVQRRFTNIWKRKPAPGGCSCAMPITPLT